ncbi:MAG: hypothetical protein ABSE59_11775, partial [Opitutaceae bacterium]
GVRQSTTDGTTVTVATNRLTVANPGPGESLTGPDVILVANLNLTLASGAQVTQSGTLPNSAETLLLGNSTTAGSGDGTLLRVSSDPSASIVRTSVNPGNAATISIIGNATISGESIILDSTGTASLNATLNGSAIKFGSGQISLLLDNPGPLQPTAGLILSSGTLQELENSATSLSLLSYSSIDIYGTGAVGLNAVGQPTLANLSLHAGEIRGFNTGGGNATFYAQNNILLDNSASGTDPGPSPTATTLSGALTFDAGPGTITLGANQLAIDQYGSVTLNADNGIAVQGTGGLATQGSLVMNTPVLTGANGASQTITAGTGIPGTTMGGGLTVANPNGLPVPVPLANDTSDDPANDAMKGLGVSLTLIGAENGVSPGSSDGVTIDNTSVILHSGTLSVEADHGDLSVGGTVDVSGTGKPFFGVSEYTGGGQITLTSDNGNVNLAAGSAVNVSAQPQAGSAGTLAIYAPAMNNFSVPTGALSGQGGAGGQAGTFSLDVGSIPGGNLDALGSLLFAGGFTQSISVRDRADSSVLLDGNGKLTAHAVNLSADAGMIEIAGTIDASGILNANQSAPLTGSIDPTDPTGGTISLAAEGNLQLDSTAWLNAAGFCYSDAGKGGSISLSAGSYTSSSFNASAFVNLAPGAQIDLGVANHFTPEDMALNPAVAAPVDNRVDLFTGTLQVVEPQTAFGSGTVLIGSLGTDLGKIDGASSIVLAGLEVFNLSSASTSSASVTAENTSNGVITNGITNSVEADVMTDGKNFVNSVYASNGSFLLNNPSIAIEPSAEIVNNDATTNQGNITLPSTWDLSTFRFGPNVDTGTPNGDGSGEPGLLTLRAVGNLVFDSGASLSDGFGPTPASSAGGEWQARLMPAPTNGQSETFSWSYNLTAGADLTAADASRVLPTSELNGAGSLQLGYGFGSNTLTSPANDTNTIEQYYQVIRTGTGNINIFAGQDVQLLNPLATIYTAGSQVPALPASEFSQPNLQYYNVSSGLTAPNSFETAGANPYPAQYSQDGGDVTIFAQHDIVDELLNTANGQTTPDSSAELPTNWLYRRGYVNASNFAVSHTILGNSSRTSGGTPNHEISSTTWWVDFSNFFEDVGALGGGNVTLTAGHDIANVDAVAPTNARVTYQLPNGDKTAADQTLFELGGGDVAVKAGHDINGGVYYVERGSGTLSAGNEIRTNITRSTASSLDPSYLDSTSWLPTTLFLGEGSFDVTAGGSVVLGPVANPFLLPQGIDNSYYDRTYFSTYATTDAVKVSSLAGSVTLQDDPNNGNPDSGSLAAWYGYVLEQGYSGSLAQSQPWLGLVDYVTSGSQLGYFKTAAALMPGTLQATAFSGDVNLVGSLTLSPSSSGTIDLAAAGSINGLQKNSLNVWDYSQIDLSDTSPNNLPGIYDPLSLTFTASQISAQKTGIIQVNAWGTEPSDSPVFLGSFTALFTESGATMAVPGNDFGLQTEETLHGTSLRAGTDVLGPLHDNDTTGPIQLYAGTGDISGLELFAGKAAQVVAGSDITDIALYLQNDAASDVSVVNAGRDIIAFDQETPLRKEAGNDLTGAAEAGDIQIGGPGTLEVLAGRNLDLGIAPVNTTQVFDGTSAGITSIGN